MTLAFTGRRDRSQTSQRSLIARYAGRYAEAIAACEEALTLGRESGDECLVARLLMSRGILAREQGDFARAQGLLDEALGIYRAMDSLTGRAIVLENLGALAEDRRDYARARAALRESLALTRQTRSAWILVFALESLASLAAIAAVPERALRLLAAAAALRERHALPLPPLWRERVERTEERARHELDDATAASAWADGRALTLEDAIQEAMAEDEPDGWSVAEDRPDGSL